MMLSRIFNAAKSDKVPKISTEDRIMWYGSLASVSAVDISLHQALKDMEPSFLASKHPLYQVVSLLLFRLRGGGESLPGVAKRSVGTELAAIVPREEAMLIQAGEKSGRISEGFANAAQVVRTKNLMSSKVLGLLGKPIAYLAMLMGMFVFFRVMLVPSFELTHPRETWPVNARIFGAITDHIYIILAIVVAMMAGTVAFFKYVVPRWAGPFRERCDSHFPMNLVASLNGVSFLRSLAAYTGAGLPATSAIPEIGASGTPYLRWQCEKTMALMKQGMRLDEALSRIALIPLRFHWIIAVYSNLKDASVAYNMMAESMTKEVVSTLEFYFGKVLGSLIFLILTCAMIFVWSTFFGISTAKG